MRVQTREYLSRLMEQRGPFHKILDVGSMNVMGGRIDDLFRDKAGVEYTGLDMRTGDNVDLVINAHDIKKHLKKQTFDLVLCFDTLEHDDKFWLTVENMRWVLKRGGWLMIGVPSRFCPEHDHPRDYWRFMPQTMKDVFLKDYLFIETLVDYREGLEDEVYGWGRKP